MIDEIKLEEKIKEKIQSKIVIEDPVVKITFKRNGNFIGPKTSNCKTTQTKNNLTAAPNILDMKKNQAPVR